MSGRILITGGAGFIGTHLAKYLVDSGYTVCLVDSFLRGVRDRDLELLLSKQQATFSTIDLLNREAALSLGSDFDVIFHLAAIVGVAHVTERPYETLVDNVKMIDNVIELAKKQTKFSRLFFASSSEVYAGTLKYFQLPLPTPESTGLTITPLEESRTSYMLSKIVGEVMCQQAGLPFTIFRPHNVYGPRMGMVHIIPEQLRKIWEADPDTEVGVYSPDHRRSFCFIDDAVEMLKKMLETETCAGKTLNLGNESPEVTIRKVVQTCIDITGKKLTIKALSPTPGSPERRAPDMKQCQKILNYQPKVSLAEGISKTWAWYCEHIFEGSGPTAR